MVVFGASFMNKKRFSNTLSLFISLFSLQGFSQDHPTNIPGTSKTEQQQEIKEETCSFISETYRQAIANHYNKELPSSDQNNKDNFDPRHYRDLLLKLGINNNESTYYSQASLKEDYEKIRNPTYDNIKSKDFRISQETIAKYIDNFRNCLDSSITAIKKEHYKLENFDSLDPVAKDLFKNLKNENSKKIKENEDVISYFHEKLNYYTGICQKAHFPPTIDAAINETLYSSLIAGWLEDNFGAKKRHALKMQMVQGHSRPSDLFHIKLAIKQQFGNSFETNLKGEPYFRISSCLSGKCKESLKDFIKSKSSQPAFQKLITDYKEEISDIKDASNPIGNKASHFAYLKKLSEDNKLYFSYDPKNQRIIADPKLFSDVLPDLFKQGNEDDKKSAKQALDVFFGKNPTLKYLSYINPESEWVKAKNITDENEFRSYSDQFTKDYQAKLSELKDKRNEVLNIFKDQKDLQTSLKNPLLLQDKDNDKETLIKKSLSKASATWDSAKKFTAKHLGQEKASTEELNTRWTEATRSMNAIDQQINRLHDKDFNPDKIIKYQKELKRINNKREKGSTLTEYEKKLEPQIATELLALLTKAVPFLSENDSKDLHSKLNKLCSFLKNIRSITEYGYSNYCHYPTEDTRDPQEMTQRVREWPIEKWFEDSDKVKTFIQNTTKLETLKTLYRNTISMDQELLQSHETLISKKPTALILGNQAIIPDPNESQKFRIMPAYGNSPDSLESQVNQIKHDLDQDLETLQINQYKFKGFKIDNKRNPSTGELETSLTEQLEGQRGNALYGLGYGTMDFIYRAEKLFPLLRDHTIGVPLALITHTNDAITGNSKPHTDASPQTQAFLQQQNETYKNVEENVQKIKDLGIPNYASTQDALALPFSLETINLDYVHDHSAQLAIESYNLTADNYNTAVEAIATLPVGSVAWGGSRLALNAGKIVRSVAIAEKGSRLTTLGSLYRKGALAGEITLEAGMKAAAHNQLTLFGFGGATTLASNVSHNGQKHGLSFSEWNNLLEGMDHAVLGSLETSGAFYTAAPNILSPIGDLAGKGAALARLPQGASVIAKNAVEHGYWGKLGWESWNEQTHALENSEKEMDKDTRAFVKKELQLMAGFIIGPDGKPKFDPKAAQKEAAQYFKQKSNHERDIILAQRDKWIHGVAGMGLPALQIHTGIRSGLKTEPAFNARQALQTIGYKGAIPKDLSPEFLQENQEIHALANQYYINRTLEIEAERTSELEQERAKQKKPQDEEKDKTSMSKKEKEINLEKDAQLIAAGINVNLAKGTIRSRSQEPEGPPPLPETKRETESCGVSNAIEILPKKE